MGRTALFLLLTTVASPLRPLAGQDSVTVADSVFEAAVVRSPTSWWSAVDSLRRRSPAADARGALAAEDTRLWVTGSGVCGAERLPFRDLLPTYGLRPMPWTGDLVIQQGTDTSHSVWQNVAHRYACAYNRVILARKPLPQAPAPKVPSN
jgi:hypothetical protein